MDRDIGIVRFLFPFDILRSSGFALVAAQNAPVPAVCGSFLSGMPGDAGDCICIGNHSSMRCMLRASLSVSRSI